ncbi:MAG TPA: four helix bundle protein [Chitinophagales bacterium]|nr:four helix bundle protein [Chitinophagales bacterium]HNL83928.1 four helix bundle protein [Chitinophagales bacterium]
MMIENKDILKSKSFSFAVKIINLYKILTVEMKEFVISKQILRSGTSVGANVRESKNAESAMDFIHKLSIAQIECDESLYWLELLYTTEFINKEMFDSLSNDATEILKIIRSSILTKKKNLKRN